MNSRKKLIEVALPLETINAASKHEKDIHTGHPANLHSWWAGRPLAACRAVLFAQLVDDPGNSLPEAEAVVERERLFRIIERLVLWDNNQNHELLEQAHAEILKSSHGTVPVVADPFCGRGSIPLEAQRLGLMTAASDLNPIAVMITSALIELPFRFAGRPPMNPESREKFASRSGWKGALGLAEDVRYYSRWMRAQAERKIGHLYPKFRLPKTQGVVEATVIAWLWTRTATCPNPACSATMPLLSTLWLSKKADEQAWLQPIVDRRRKAVTFEVCSGEGKPLDPPKVGRGSRFRCFVCGEVADDEAIKLTPVGTKMTAVLVVDASGRRWYLPASEEMEALAAKAKPQWWPSGKIPARLSGGTCVPYGMNEWGDLFTSRQLVGVTAFCDLVREARELAMSDGADKEYADAIATYLAFAVDRLAQTNCKLVRWLVRSAGPSKGTPILDKQALPMVWDFSEGNVLGDSVGSWDKAVMNVLTAFGAMAPFARTEVRQLDAATTLPYDRVIFCTDPPYYGNISYADLSDFFYVWLRRSLGDIRPDLFSTIQTPKAEELVAAPYRFGGDGERAKRFFEDAFGNAFSQIRAVQHEDYPLTVFYAFKQAEADESDDGGAIVVSTGWETMLEGLIRAGFIVTGTWPIRTERAARGVALGTNALASSVVLVCRPRKGDAPVVSRGEFLGSLRLELPLALKALQRGNIAPVDLAQAAIGPGMAVYTRYAKVLDAEGKPLSVREALALINQTLDESLAEQEGDFDADSRWALAWLEHSGFAEGDFGVADVLARAKNTSVDGIRDAGILKSSRGKVRLLRPDELPSDWDPATDTRLTAWEVVHHLVRVLEVGGETSAAQLVSKLGSKGEVARELAYRLFTICERKKRAPDALAYNRLVQSWPEITRLARESGKPKAEQAQLFERE